MGKPRLHTDSEGYFLHQYQWDLLVERICLDYQKLLRDKPDFHHTHTALVEFSRGSEHGGYRSAFQHISHEVAERMAVLYLDVLLGGIPAEESKALSTPTNQTASWSTDWRTPSWSDCTRKWIGRRSALPIHNEW